MERGDKITAKTFDDKFLECRLVEIRGRTAVICSEREWEAARRQRREPDCLGWPLADIKERASEKSN